MLVKYSRVPSYYCCCVHRLKDRRVHIHPSPQIIHTHYIPFIALSSQDYSNKGWGVWGGQQVALHTGNFLRRRMRLSEQELGWRCPPTAGQIAAGSCKHMSRVSTGGGGYWRGRGQGGVGWGGLLEREGGPRWLPQVLLRYSHTLFRLSFDLLLMDRHQCVCSVNSLRTVKVVLQVLPNTL